MTNKHTGSGDEALRDADSAGCLCIVGSYADAAREVGVVVREAARRFMRSPVLGDFIELRFVDIGPRPKKEVGRATAVERIARELASPMGGAGRNYFALVIADQSAAAVQRVLADCSADPLVAALPIRCRGLASEDDRAADRQKPSADIVVSPDGAWDKNDFIAELRRFADDLLQDFAMEPEAGLTDDQLDRILFEGDESEPAETAGAAGPTPESASPPAKRKLDILRPSRQPPEPRRLDSPLSTRTTQAPPARLSTAAGQDKSRPASRPQSAPADRASAGDAAARGAPAWGTAGGHDLLRPRRRWPRGQVKRLASTMERVAGAAFSRAAEEPAAVSGEPATVMAAATQEPSVEQQESPAERQPQPPGKRQPETRRTPESGIRREPPAAGLPPQPRRDPVYGLIYLVLSGARDQGDQAAAWRHCRSLLLRVDANLAEVSPSVYWIRSLHNLAAKASAMPRPAGHLSRRDFKGPPGDFDFTRAMSIIQAMMEGDLNAGGPSASAAVRPVIVFFATTVPLADGITAEMYGKLARQTSILWVVSERAASLMSPMFSGGEDVTVIIDHRASVSEEAVASRVVGHLRRIVQGEHS